MSQHVMFTSLIELFDLQNKIQRHPDETTCHSEQYYLIQEVLLIARKYQVNFYDYFHKIIQIVVLCTMPFL